LRKRPSLSNALARAPMAAICSLCAKVESRERIQPV
jgi:hypothetical protein